MDEDEDDFEFEEIEVNADGSEQPGAGDKKEAAVSEPPIISKDFVIDGNAELVTEPQRVLLPHQQAVTFTAEDEADGRHDVNGEQESDKPIKPRRAPPTTQQRQARVSMHKAILAAQIALAQVRFKQVSSPLLLARILSLVPLAIASHVLPLSPQAEPNAGARARHFEAGLRALTQWYKKYMTVNHHVRSVEGLTYGQTLNWLRLYGSSNVWLDAKNETNELIRSSKSFAKRLLERRCGRDVAVWLFVGVCKALGIPTRLVASLRAIPWRMAGSAKAEDELEGLMDEAETSMEQEKERDRGKKRTPKSTPTKKGRESKEATSSPYFDDGEMELVAGAMPINVSDTDGSMASTASKGSVKALTTHNRPPIKLRKSRPPKGHLRRLSPPPSNAKRASENQSAYDATVLGPHNRDAEPAYWVEVYSRADSRWISVDPLRNLVGKEARRRESDVYVLAFEDDGSARDVTVRYARHYSTKVSKLRLPTGRGGDDWWAERLAFLARPYRLQRDALEDEELDQVREVEAMPDSMAGFKDHPRFVLARHVKKDEVVYPETKVATFKGEAVYRRSNLWQLKSRENWLRSGREIKPEEVDKPMKEVAARAVTLGRRRQIEVAKEAGAEAVDPMYAEWQTRMYRAPPIQNGEIPKNSFGNIDLYAPTMLPPGSVHLPYRGIAKIAKKMGISFAEAVTGFEFRQQRANPVLTGIVVAAEHEDDVMEAFREYEEQVRIREEQKMRVRVFARWKRLIHGLQVRQRLAQAGQETLERMQRHNEIVDGPSQFGVQGEEMKQQALQEPPVKSVGPQAHAKGRKTNTQPTRSRRRVQDSSSSSAESSPSDLSDSDDVSDSASASIPPAPVRPPRTTRSRTNGNARH